MELVELIDPENSYGKKEEKLLEWLTRAPPICNVSYIVEISIYTLREATSVFRFKQGRVYSNKRNGTKVQRSTN